MRARMRARMCVLICLMRVYARAYECVNIFNSRRGSPSTESIPKPPMIMAHEDGCMIMHCCFDQQALTCVSLLSILAGGVSSSP